MYIAVASHVTYQLSLLYLCVCAEGRRYFREFLRSEFSEENLLFWLACKDLKREDDTQRVEDKARLIYEDYISIISPTEVGCQSIINLISHIGLKKLKQF